MSVESIVVDLTAGKIGELLVKEAKFLYGVKKQFRSLQGELTWMTSFLKDMEVEDEEGGDERSRTIIKEIRKIAYDAEDLIESYILESKSSANKTRDFFRTYVCFCSYLARAHKVGCEIQTIRARISETMERSKRYQGENGGRRASREGLNRARSRRSIAYPHVYEDHVVGLEEDINKLVGLLTAKKRQIQVLSIVGMGGSGKTTLARKLYNHESIKQYFHCMVWVSISEQWVAQHILLDILRNAGDETMRLGEAWSPQVVAEKLHLHLERKRYLIVLDDVWAKQALEEILLALPSGDGRKIIVTTQMREIVDLKCCIHEPRPLTEEESWDVFQKIALSHREETNCMDIFALEELAKEMLKKCEGLPLAVVALAGLLSKKDALEDWEKIKKAVSSKIMEVGRGTHLYGTVKEMLLLSYSDLPRELKLCFLYLAIFPEDYEIQRGMLIRMWIAEGFITSDQVHEGETLEDVATQYLYELIQRCVVHVARRNYDGKVKSIRIHDLMRDLCVKKAKEQNFLDIFSSRSTNLDIEATQSRRTTIHSCERMYFPFPTENGHLRSVLFLNRSSDPNLPKLSFTPMYKNFRLLRALGLICVRTSDGSLPTEIGSLIHLRYLGLRVTNICELPSSIGNLQNLLTLDYRGLLEFDKPVKIPDVLWKIKGLRHLYLPFTIFVTNTMKRFKLHTLKHLQSLCGVGGGDWMLKELPHLSDSVHKLRIGGITSIEQLEATFQCQSIKSDRLRTLYLDWMWEQNVGVNPSLKNLEPIAHCQGLKKLRLRGRMEDRLAWTGFPSSIKKVRLWGTRFGAEATLGALGKLPNLKFLQLWTDSYVGTKWNCTAGEFSQLKELILCFLENLEEWSVERGAMCQLRMLRVRQCSKLSRLPDGLKFITTLQELEFKYMKADFYSRIKRVEGGGEDAHIIQHIPVVRYLD